MIPPSYLFRPIYDRAWTDPDPVPSLVEEGGGGGSPRRPAAAALRLLRELAWPAPARRADAL